MNGRYRFNLFGVNIESDLKPPAAPAPTGPVELTIVSDPHLSFVGPVAFSIPRPGPDGHLTYGFRHGKDGSFLRLAPVADYVCADDRISYRPLGNGPRESLLWQLYGLVFAVWLERRGYAVFHAGAVEVDGQAVAFLGASCTGKSTLTAAFIRHGHRVLTDEHLVIDGRADPLRALPALPWLKVGSALASWLGCDLEALGVLHPAAKKRQFNIPTAALAPRAVPLGRVYSLQRDPAATGVSIRPVDLADSVRMLIGHSYAPRSVAAAGFDVARLRVLAKLLGQGRVWHLRYPHGLDRLAEVVLAIRRHGEGLLTESLPPTATSEWHDLSR